MRFNEKAYEELFPRQPKQAPVESAVENFQTAETIVEEVEDGIGTATESDS